MSAVAAREPGPMRVLHVIEAMHQGGAESLVVEHVRHAGPGVEVQVCALNRGGPALEQARALGAKVTVLRAPGAGGAAARLRAVGALARLAREGGVTVMNGHNPSGALHAWLAARLGGGAALVRTEHSLHYPGRHSRLYPLVERFATASTHCVVCVCEAVRESHARRMPSHRDRFVTVRNGIGPPPPLRPRPETRAALALADDHLAVLAVGSLTPQKQQSTLITAFARVARELPRARLLIAGEGPLAPALEAQAGAPELVGRVRFLGARDDVADLLAAVDLFALSSVREGLPVTLLEAMRAGRAAVATDVGGCGEAILDGETGRVVPVGDADALGGAIAGLLRDPVRREAMGVAARARWAQRFTAARMVAETEAIYRRALEVADGSRSAGARKERRRAPA